MSAWVRAITANLDRDGDCATVANKSKSGRWRPLPQARVGGPATAFAHNCSEIDVCRNASWSASASSYLVATSIISLFYCP
ncbi:hypothetical protein J6590_019797 [Homalodisca vitripennis]|nr:hypothetical protein J6590_019797 [Homalodisca vitripennis]